VEVAPGGLKGVRVLIVDPDPRTGQQSAAALRSAGADAQVVQEAEAALLVLDSFRPRVLVLDLVLPRMSGLLLAQRLVAASRGDAPVIIGVGFFSDPDVERLARQAGCAAYVRRPLFPAPLVRLIAGRLRGDA
jgi:DNA-binding response OmpR family regulator